MTYFVFVKIESFLTYKKQLLEIATISNSFSSSSICELKYRFLYTNALGHSGLVEL